MVAAVIAATARAQGSRVGVFKPAVSGLAEPGETDHELLRRAAGSAQDDDDIAPYRYDPPVSPHLAAELAGETIDVGRLVEAAAEAARDTDLLVVEGVGGLLVPLTSDYLVRNLAVALGLPLVIAAASGLGTINHTLLTLEAAWTAELEVAAVVLTPWPSEPEAIHESNREAIENLGGVAVRTLPQIDPAEPASWPPLEIEPVARN